MAALNDSHQKSILDAKQAECLDPNDNETYGLLHSTLDYYCPRFWDTMACWEPTPPNTTAWIACPSYVHNFNPTGNASRFCTENGTWYTRLSIRGQPTPYANYTQCTDGVRLLTFSPPSFSVNLTQTAISHIRLMSICGYSISMIFLLAAIIILMSVKTLHCPRNTLHINLFISFIFKAVTTMIKSGNFMENDNIDAREEYFSKNSVGCRALYTVFNYAIMANYFWIFVEGFYLNSMVTFSVFSDHSKIWMYILAGWLPPIIFVGTWAGVRYSTDDTACWAVNDQQVFWILRGPITALIICNMIFFINIVVVIFIQFRRQTSLREQQASTTTLKYRKFAKATLVLLAVFGVHFFVLLIFHHAIENSLNVYLELIWLFIDTFFTSFQGLLASVLFCFANGEVRNELNRCIFRQRATLNNLRRSSSRQSYQSSRFIKVIDDRNQSVTNSRQVSRENSLHVRPFNHNNSINKKRLLQPPKIQLNLHSCESVYIHTTENSLDNSEDEMDTEITRTKVTNNGDV